MVAGRNCDIVLSDIDGSTNAVEVNLWKDNPNLPGGFQTEYLSPAPPRQAGDSANYQQQSPDVGLVMDQDSWHRGFGETFIERFDTASSANRARAKYGYTEGVLPMFKGELALGYQEDSVDMILRNGRFESGATTGWTGTNTTLAINTTAERSGSYACQVTVGADNGYMYQDYGGTVSVARSREITFAAYLYRTSGSGTAAMKIVDSAGNTTGSTVTHNSGYGVAYVTRTINSGATSLQFQIVFSNDEDVWLVDDIVIIPTGGVTFTPVQEFEGNSYLGIGRTICKWNDSDFRWDVVYWDSGYAITDLISFEGNLYAARGTTVNYLYSGDGTTWSDPSNNSGNPKLAVYFSRCRNANGDWALAKSRANYVAISTNPTDTANFGAEIQVGDQDREINKLFSANDILFVGREDGLFSYNTVTNTFEDLQPEANLFPDADNFKSAIGRAGAIYATGGDQSFWKISPSGGGYAWQDLSYLFKAPAFRGFGGRITAMAQDRNNLWLALADDLQSNLGFPYDFPISFATAGISQKIRVLALRTQKDDVSGVEDIAHTITVFDDVTNVTQLGRFAGDSRGSLFVCGSYTNTDLASATNDTEPRIIRMRMPVKNEHPSNNATVEHRLDGYFYSPWINFNYPDVTKAGVKMTINGMNLDSNIYAKVHYKTDDATDDDSQGWNVWGSDGKFTSNGQTVSGFSSSLLNFNRIRFRIQLVTNVHTKSPRITGIVLHAVWNPIDYRKWTLVAKLSDKAMNQLRRTPRRTLRTTDISNLESLRQKSFITFTDPDGTSHNVKLRYSDQMISSRVYATRDVTLDQTRAITMELTEVKT